MTPCSNTTLVSDPDCLSSPTEPLSSTRTGLFVFTQPALICSVLMEQASVMGMRNVSEASVFEHLVLVVLFGVVMELFRDVVLLQEVHPQGWALRVYSWVHFQFSLCFLSVVSQLPAVMSFLS